MEHQSHGQIKEISSLTLEYCWLEGGWMNGRVNEWTLEFRVDWASLDGCEVEMGAENGGDVVSPGYLYHGNLLTAVSAISLEATPKMIPLFTPWQ